MKLFGIKCSVKFPFSSSSSLNWNWICDKTDENDHLQAFKYKFAIMHFIKVFVKTISNRISLSCAFPVMRRFTGVKTLRGKVFIIKILPHQNSKLLCYPRDGRRCRDGNIELSHEHTRSLKTSSWKQKPNYKANVYKLIPLLIDNFGNFTIIFRGLKST